MSFQRYPAYRDSGVEWLGEVPAHWEVLPGRRLFEQRRDAALPDDAQLSATQKYGVVPQDIFMKMEDQKVVLALSGTGNFKHLEENDFVISLRSFQGGIEWSRYAGCVSPAYTVLRSTMTSFPAYWAYVFKSEGYISALQAVTEGIRDGKTISYDQFGIIGLVLPSLEEQSAIATFLDRETARIDALVTEQEKLIDLLKEKRQAVISRAVTKGLDPQVPMKDSGIAWLGEVPAHWDVVPVSYRYEVQLGKMLDGNKITGKNLRPYLRVFDVQWDKINIDDLPEMDFDQEDRVRYSLRAGDLLVNEGGSYVGRSAVWRGEMEECYYQKALHRLRPHDKVADTAEFFLFVMENATRQGVFVAGGNQATIEHLTAEALRRYRFAFPPRQEQEDIAAHLRRETERYGALITEAQKAITLLKERRAALISAAVTGRIDVRDRVAAGATEAA
ncbi:restriction endonuclease subunit S [Tistrella mobilis]